VTTVGDIYIGSYSSIDGVSKWTLNSTVIVPIMYTCQMCYDLFVDISNTLYCSMSDFHLVVTKPLNSGSNALTIIAGTGSTGSASNMLNHSYGIFVDINFDLYVADSGNDRIQLFRSGQLNATTVAGNGSLNTTITLDYPTGIVLDADKYLFIVDSHNNRIVGSGPNGFRCIVGCSMLPGSASKRLSSPRSMAFDNYGNMFVTDRMNNRIQKFSLTMNVCGKCNKN
jgi:DNA-binding beta-propeller fold protein YncE